MLLTTANGSNEPDLDIKTIKKRFMALNRERLRRTQQALRWKQRDFLDLLPLFFHVNHAMVPGYISKDTPSGIPLYTPSKNGLDALKGIAKSFVYKRRALRTYDIESIFIMGSVGTVAQSENSDFDIWICYSEELTANQLVELKAKCNAIERWAEAIGLEVHFFTMNAKEFKDGKVHELSSESSGSTQYHLLLEEFYRTGILVAGRYPVWWLVPPEEERNYDAYVQRLLHKRFVPQNEVIDFGGLSHVPVEEFFGAALWQVYKGIDSPYKSVLKILLMETYAGAYPQTQLLSLSYKQRIYQGQVNINELDPYGFLISHIEKYLQERNELHRLELVRRCFYFKVNIPLSLIRAGQDDWQREYLLQLTGQWGWDKSTLAILDRRQEWKIQDVLNERKILVEELTNSYLFLSNFARHNVSLSRIDQKDLNVLGRKLYAAFERKAGKIELVNRGISRNVVERKLTIQRYLTKEGEESWSLIHEAIQEGETVSRPIKRGRSVTELIAWCHFNRIINPGTVITLEAGGGILTVKEVRSVLEALDRQFPEGRLPPAEIADLEKTPVIVSGCVFTNVGLDPLPMHTKRGNDLVSDKTDALNYSGFSYNLALSFDLIAITSWQEILTYRYSGVDGLLNCLCEYLNWNLKTLELKPPPLNIYSYASPHSSSIARRIEELITDVTGAFYSDKIPKLVRYVLEVQQSYYVLVLENDKFNYTRTESEAELYTQLSLPQQTFMPIVADRFALEKTVLPQIFPKTKPNKIQLFYEKVGDNANIYVLDECGSLFYQKLPFHDDHALINQFSLFFDSVLDRRNLQLQDAAVQQTSEYIEFCRVTKVIDRKCVFERKTISSEKLRQRYFHVQVIGNVVEQKTVFTVYCDDREFSSFDHGRNLFREVARHVLSRRAGGVKYLIYITDLDLAPALLGDRAASTVQIIEFLNYKKRIEESLNKELESM